MKQILVNLDEKMFEDLADMRWQRRLNKSELVRQYLREGLERDMKTDPVKK